MFYNDRPYSLGYTNDQRPQREYRRTPSIGHKRLRLRLRNELIALGITQEAVLDAMYQVPRHLFVQEALRAKAYENTSLPIGLGQTISQPYTVAMMSELLEIQKGMRVLEIGTGSGYQAAVLATMGCYVFSIERLRELHLKTRALLRSLGYQSIHMQCGDGTLGFPQAAPFDRIIVTAGGPEIPQPLVNQLDNQGIMLIPVGSKQRLQNLIRIRKNHNTIHTENLGPAVFVNLVGNYGWQNR
ncbi:MAG: protein-L-isoaspartate(D-aspartate) O-methyltransferase [Desulfovibrionaceae bacterium]|nr:protein-L-isoaspartate(D-aspartate) O-methyltransferase [Desulfovibrionaceae bacterium]